MNSIAVSTMLFGALLFVPYVLGKDVVSELTISFSKALDRSYLPSLLSIGLIKDIVSVCLIIGSVFFWYYWSRSTLIYEISLLAILSISIISTGLIYLLDHLLLKSPSFSTMPFRIIAYVFFIISLVGSIGVIWIPISIYLVCRFWRLLKRVPLLVSGIGGYIIFMVGMFLFLIANQ